MLRIRLCRRRRRRSSDGLFRAGRRAAGAVAAFGCATRRALQTRLCVPVAVGRSRAQSWPSGSPDAKSPRRRCPAGGQSAGRTGLVIDGLFRAGRAGFQILRFSLLGREAMRRRLAVGAAAGRADCPFRAGRRAAGAVAAFGVRRVALADAGVRAVAVGRPRAPVMAERLAILRRYPFPARGRWSRTDSTPPGWCRSRRTSAGTRSID